MAVINCFLTEYKAIACMFDVLVAVSFFDKLKVVDAAAPKLKPVSIDLAITGKITVVFFFGVLVVSICPLTTNGNSTIMAANLLLQFFILLSSIYFCKLHQEIEYTTTKSV
jgi:hypothetical protein